MPRPTIEELRAKDKHNKSALKSVIKRFQITANYPEYEGQTAAFAAVVECDHEDFSEVLYGLTQNGNLENVEVREL